MIENKCKSSNIEVEGLKNELQQLRQELQTFKEINNIDIMQTYQFQQPYYGNRQRFQQPLPYQFIVSLSTTLSISSQSK